MGSGRLARWSLQLQDLDIEIVHRSGRLHSDADGLSRAPTGCPEEEKEIPLLNNFPVISGVIDIGSAQRQSTWWEVILRGMSDTAPSSRIRKRIQPYELTWDVLHRRRIRRGEITYQLCLPETVVDPLSLAPGIDMQ